MVNELRQLEKKIAFRYLEDGFWDMYLGLMALSFGLTILLDINYLTAIMVSIGMALQSLGKSKITYPRIGYVKFKKRKKRAIASVFSGVFVLGLMIFALTMLGTSSRVYAFIQENMLLVIAVIWGGAIAVAGLTFNANRFYAYAAFIFFAVLLSDKVGGLGINLTLCGTAIMITGLVIMVRFIRKYPIIPPQE